MTWRDMEAMLDDMKAYVERTGATIINSDDPNARTIGFQALFVEDSDYAIVAEIMEEDPPRWEIPLTAVSTTTHPKTPRQEMMSGAFRTLPTRKALIQSLLRHK